MTSRPADWLINRPDPILRLHPRIQFMDARQPQRCNAPPPAPMKAVLSRHTAEIDSIGATAGLQLSESCQISHKSIDTTPFSAGLYSRDAAPGPATAWIHGRAAVVAHRAVHAAERTPPAKRHPSELLPHRRHGLRAAPTTPPCGKRRRHQAGLRCRLRRTICAVSPRTSLAHA